MASRTSGWLPGRDAEVPHPIAAGNRLEGGTVKGGACVIASATRPAGAPLTGPSWRAAQSEADEAPMPVRLLTIVKGWEDLKLRAAVLLWRYE